MEIYWDQLPVEYEEILTDLVKRYLKYVNAPKSSEISISFVDQDEIKELNNKYRGINRPTDVLSFPLDNWKYDNRPVISDYPVVLGDVIICVDIAREQAQSYGHSYKRELGFLLVHGLLHLAGYDHTLPEEEERMRNAQREILGGLL